MTAKIGLNTDNEISVCRNIAGPGTHPDFIGKFKSSITVTVSLSFISMHAVKNHPESRDFIYSPKLSKYDKSLTTVMIRNSNLENVTKVTICETKSISDLPAKND